MHVRKVGLGFETDSGPKLLFGRGGVHEPFCCAAWMNTLQMAELWGGVQGVRLAAYMQ